MALKIVTWNVNSVRLRLDLLGRLADEYAPDLVCLQETKVRDGEFPAAAIRAMGFTHLLINGRKMHAGVAILSRAPITEGERRDWCGRADARHVCAVLPDGVEVHNFYVPAGGDIADPRRNDKFAHKLAFLAEMTAWSAAGRDHSRPRILAGDLNVAPLETDVWSHKQLLKVVSHTPVEVAALDGVAAAHGWIDAVRRIIPPSRRLYTWWSYRARDWEASDRGRRLDHIWVTPALAGRLETAQVIKAARGWPKASDHAPVMATIAI